MQEIQSTHKTPGHLIEAALEKRDWTKKTLAIVIDLDEAALNRIISAQRSITADIALAMEEVLGIKAIELLELQKNLDLARARIASKPDLERSQRAKLYGDLKVSELLKRGWVEVRDPKDVSEISSSVERFFGMSQECLLNGGLNHAARKSQPLHEATITQLAWIQRVKQIAASLNVPAYSEDKLERAISELHSGFADPEFISEVPRILHTAGVRYAVVETLPTAKIDGVCLWLEDREPVIGMSTRFDRIDNFWFVLRHEIQHVLQGDGKDDPNGIWDTDAELSPRNDALKDLPSCEKLANKAATDFCIPTASMDNFISENNPYFSEKSLLSFSEALGVHPGLVAGQLQHRTDRHDRFRKHQIKIRPYLLKSATVDGWGSRPRTANQERDK